MHIIDDLRDAMGDSTAPEMNLTIEELAHIRELRRMSPVGRGMVIDLAAEYSRRFPEKAPTILRLVRPAD